MSTPIAIVFCVLYLVVYWLLVLQSVHGAESLLACATVYLLIAFAATWVARMRRLPMWASLLLGGGFVVAGLLLPLVTLVSEEWVTRRNIARTEVSNLSDEVFPSPAGGSLGIRVAFDVRFPSRGYRFVDVSLSPDAEYFQAIRPRIADRAYGPAPVVMRVVARRIAPSPQKPVPGGGEIFEPGRWYHFEYDTVPSYVRKQEGDGYCVVAPTPANWQASRETFDALVQGDVAARYEIQIFGTPYVRSDNGPSRLTSNRYRPKDFWDAVEAEHLPACEGGSF